MKSPDQSRAFTLNIYEKKRRKKYTRREKKNKSVFISAHFGGKMCVEMASDVRKNLKMTTIRRKVNCFNQLEQKPK